jgi:hypothetical protein
MHWVERLVRLVRHVKKVMGPHVAVGKGTMENLECRKTKSLEANVDYCNDGRRIAGNKATC